MKWSAVALALALAAVPAFAKPHQQGRAHMALVFPPTGHIATVSDNSPTVWGLSGYEMIKVAQSVNGMTPIMRTELWDARTVEILSGTQNPPLRPSDIRPVSMNGHDYVAVRRFILLEVTPEDARANGMNRSAVANKWAASVRKVFPVVAPGPSRFGI